VMSVSQNHLPPLGAHVRDEVGRELEATLVELIDLGLVGKHLHWNVVGPFFRPLHQQLDELVDSWHELADAVAERAVAIGFQPDGQARAVVARSEIDVLESGAVAGRTVVRELAHRLQEVAERARARMDRLGELDIASQDVLIDVVRALEEQLWMIRAQMEGGA
jgi:starvation-inducible DNA-binding protein